MQMKMGIQAIESGDRIPSALARDDAYKTDKSGQPTWLGRVQQAGVSTSHLLQMMDLSENRVPLNELMIMFPRLGV